MTPRRRSTNTTARAGINFVRSQVEAANHVLQEIHLENDLGNDAYLEFVRAEQATGCCLAVQVKSGASYRLAGNRGYTFRADRDHFEYWRDHSLPIAAVVVDPDRGLAVWLDLTDYLRKNPHVVPDGPYSVPIPLGQRLDGDGFATFESHFLTYRDRYNDEAHFGRALEHFAGIGDEQVCFDGLKALFAFHRSRPATWYYLAQSLRSFRDHPLDAPLAIVLSHLPGHGDIFWHERNIIPDEVREHGMALIAETFGREEAIALLGAIDDNGLERGTVGQCVHVLIDSIQSVESILESISFDSQLDEGRRYWAVVMLVYRVQAKDPGRAVAILRRFTDRFPRDRDADMLQELSTTIREHGSFGLY